MDFNLLSYNNWEMLPLIDKYSLSHDVALHNDEGYLFYYHIQVCIWYLDIFFVENFKKEW